MNKKPTIEITTDVISKITFIAIGDAFTKLSKPAKQDIQTFDKFLKTVSRNMNIEYRKFIYNNESNFNTANSVNKIKNIIIDNDEVVILLYRGHGFRWADQSSNYPRMKLGDEFSSDSYNFQSLHKNLAFKNPRLLISIGDMCNTVEGISPIVSSSNDPLSQDLALTRFSLDKMAKLLLKKGTILTVSAKPGEQSYSSHDYGYYSKSFMDALQWEISEFNSKTYVSWYNILNDASRKAKELSLSKKQVYQNALFQVNLN